MVLQSGHPYGYIAILRYSLVRLGFLNALLQRLRLLKSPEQAAEPMWATPKFCSTQTEWCYRRAAKDLGLDFDPHPGLPSQFVTPNDQAHSSAFEKVIEGLVP
jgi:hypothetical protein